MQAYKIRWRIYAATPAVCGGPKSPVSYVSGGVVLPNMEELGWESGVVIFQVWKSRAVFFECSTSNRSWVLDIIEYIFIIYIHMYPT